MFIYTAEEIRKIDQQASEEGFSLFALMENAGRGIAEALQHHTTVGAHIIILAGRGNNGGDGIVAARYLKKAGYNVTLTFPLGTPKTETAKAHLAYYNQCGYTVEPWADVEDDADVVVDGLLGIGVTPPLRENVATIVQWANKQQATRIAIDLPTGLGADQGQVEGDVFQAAITFVLHGAKPSAVLHPSSFYYGKIVPIDIGVPPKSLTRQTTVHDVRTTMPDRPSAAHKGSFGTSFLIAGSNGMPGSALIAATGAIRSGTGLLMIGTTSTVASIIATQVPEAIYELDGLATTAQGQLPPKASAVGIGPGLTDQKLIAKALDHLMEANIPLVVDAGALLKGRDWNRVAATILTPHPGEFSKLTGKPITEIEANRIELARDFSQKQNVILVLKGQHTVIAFPDGSVRLNPTGNSALAKGGSGDVLTGMMTGMLSYYSNVEAAVVNAVYLHGLCAEIWAEDNSEAAMTASDVDWLLPKVFYLLEKGELQ